jgi:Holliday junction resolvasome RuvABC DNA-binding subunit
MSETYLEALKEYLGGSEWHQSIDIFVESNCKYFSNVSEMDHQQYSLWKTFQEIVEAILEMALENIGGSLQQLEDTIDLVQKQPSKGPREDLVKDVLEQLVSFTDFQSFAGMMKQACDAHELEDRLNGKHSISGQHVDALLRMGFPVAHIDATVAKANADASLEELVMAVSAYNSQHDRKGADASVKMGAGAGYSYDLHDSAPSTPRLQSAPAVDPALLKFAKEAEESGEIIDLNELNAKFVIADSILESFDAAARSQAAGGAMEDLVRWAEDMRLLLNDIHTAYEEQLPCATLCFSCSDGLISWYGQLEHSRSVIDQASVAGNMLSDGELRRMAELDKIAALGTADEQLLHSLLSRHEAVSKEVQGLHRQCGLLVASDRRGVRREGLEELYLFLKQQVASGADLETLTDELYEQVYNVVSSSRGAEVVNLLLDMHVKEDEQGMLQRRIQSLVGTEAGRDSAGDSDYIDAVRFSDVEIDEFAQMAGTHLAADHKDTVATNSAQQFVEHVGSEAKAASGLYAADAKHSPDRAVPTVASRVRDTQAEEAALAGLKEQHRTSMAQLRDLLDAEKARRLRALEDKLLRRRSLLQQTQAEGRRGSAEEALLEEQRRAVEESEAEIAEAQLNLEHVADGLQSGLKKRCLAELAAARKKLSAADDSDRKLGPQDALLTEQERCDAHRAAADALKQRFERDQQALLESLEAERLKQRARVLKSLAAKRKGRTSSQGPAAEAEEEARALVAMNVEFDGMQAAALAKAQEHALLALAAIHLSEADLAVTGPGAAGAEGEEDDDYLSGESRTASGGDLARGRAWLDRLQGVKQAYAEAGSDLFLRLRANAANTVTHGEEAAGKDSFGDAAALMTQVLTNAFHHHFEEEGAHLSRVTAAGSQRRDSGREDAVRVRAGIMEEFERTKRQLDEGHRHARATGRAKLEERRRAKQEAGAKDDGNDAEDVDSEGAPHADVEALLERAVDGFLDGEAPPDLAAVYKAALSEVSSQSRSGGQRTTAGQASRGSAEWAAQEEDRRGRERDRIRSVHVEKEQSLVRDCSCC